MASDTKKDFFLSIDKHALAELPAAKFDGKITIVDSAEQVDEAIGCLRESDIIGFDTETRPTFRKGALNEVALMQLSSRETCFLIRLNIIGLPRPVIDLLEDDRCTKVGVSIHDDFHNLHRLAAFEPKGFIDLQHFVKDFGIADNSLSRIYAILFGQRISKGQRLTNWEAETLTPAQQAYASLDATACIRIYDKLSSGSFDPAQSEFIKVNDPDQSTTANEQE